MTNFYGREFYEQLQIVQATNAALASVREACTVLGNEPDQIPRMYGYLDLLAQLATVELQLMTGLEVSSEFLPELSLPGSSIVLQAELQSRLNQAVEMLGRFRDGGIVLTADLEACLAAVTAPVGVEVRP